MQDEEGPPQLPETRGPPQALGPAPSSGAPQQNRQAPEATEPNSSKRKIEEPSTIPTVGRRLRKKTEATSAAAISKSVQDQLDKELEEQAFLRDCIQKLRRDVEQHVEQVGAEGLGACKSYIHESLSKHEKNKQPVTRQDKEMMAAGVGGKREDAATQ